MRDFSAVRSQCDRMNSSTGAPPVGARAPSTSNLGSRGQSKHPLEDTAGAPAMEVAPAVAVDDKALRLGRC
eukprot:6132132-Pyramimonas_sp.AAC.1